MASSGHSIQRNPRVDRDRPCSALFLCSVRYCTGCAFWTVAWVQDNTRWGDEAGKSDHGRSYCDRHAMRFCMAHDVKAPKELLEVFA